ncbi:MAG: hypothetical protein AYK19_01605 [Theionarchaea archaeon DG-70-1]|nr:MAG: hypothetical protein AYK19_01605 [Theionarchaea archaeon DG-70-1]
MEVQRTQEERTTRNCGTCRKAAAPAAQKNRAIIKNAGVKGFNLFEYLNTYEKIKNEIIVTRVTKLRELPLVEHHEQVA